MAITDYNKLIKKAATDEDWKEFFFRVRHAFTRSHFNSRVGFYAGHYWNLWFVPSALSTKTAPYLEIKSGRDFDANNGGYSASILLPRDGISEDSCLALDESIRANGKKWVRKDLKKERAKYMSEPIQDEESFLKDFLSLAEEYYEIIKDWALKTKAELKPGTSL